MAGQQVRQGQAQAGKHRGHALPHQRRGTQVDDAECGAKGRPLGHTQETWLHEGVAKDHLQDAARRGQGHPQQAGA